MASQLQGRRAALVRRVVHFYLRRERAYQPVVLGGEMVAVGDRGTHERLEVVLETAAAVSARSVLDLGCAEGYIVRRCAEAGYLSLGVDADARRLAAAQWSLALDGVDNYGFIRSMIDPDSLAVLPTADVTVCLSVLHHVMYEHGEAYAREMLEAIRHTTRRALVFEMGQSDEREFEWSTLLPDMGSDPHEWIAGFVRSAGFAEVHKAAEVASYNSDVRRATFVAHVPRSG